MWIFGYGSLIWKADFPYSKKVVGYINGYRRVFWQGSEDHRGVPGKPGRVVTLVRSKNPHEEVWGVAYEIPPDKREEVKCHLDYREKDGYDPHFVKFHPKDKDLEPFDLLIYLANERNPFYLGPASTEQIAEQIYHSIGPSGRNLDYLLNLADAMRNICPQVHDSHLFELESEVKQICERRRLDKNKNVIK